MSFGSTYFINSLERRKLCFLDRKKNKKYNDMRIIRKLYVMEEADMADYMTVRRKKLWDFLCKNPDRQFTAKQIMEAMADINISLSAIYRNLSYLEEKGLVNRTAHGKSNEMCYQAVEVEGCQNSIHLVCSQCGNISHMDAGEADHMVGELRIRDGFLVNRSKTMIYGTCRDCREHKTS